MPRTHEALVLDCLTNAAGWACTWRKGSVASMSMLALISKRQARRTLLSYFGHLHWIEFLALPETYRPPLFAGSSVGVDGGVVFSVPPFAGQVVLPQFSAASLLDVYVSLDPSSPNHLRVNSLSFHPLPTVRTYTLSTFEALRPREGSPTGYGADWQEMRAARPPYDNVLTVVEGQNNIARTMKPADSVGDTLYVALCRSRADDTKVDLRSPCTKSQEGTRILPGPR
jgi:hypothetical protein